MRPDIFMIAGEMSGDLLGASLIEELMEDLPTQPLDIIGIGGPLMRAYGLFPITPMEKLQVMGFIDVIRHLPRLMKIFRSTVAAILHLNPKVVITIDYPGFNLRLASTLRKKGYRGKICHVVCPSVWAWGKNRIQILAKNYDLLLTLLPFEKNLFQQTPLKVEFIGHPLVKKIAVQESPEERLIALFPGSRAKEIERNLPFFLRLIPKLHPRYQFVLSLSQERLRPLIHQMAGTSIPLLPPQEMNQRQPMLALAKCGTIALELALKGIPTVVTYKMSSSDIFIAKSLLGIQLPYYSLPNLILNRPLFPELIGPSLTDQALLKATSTLLLPDNLQACHLGCLNVRQALISSSSAAALIRTLL